ncbi:DUF3225 domain-containing protein, partial [Lacticaseibacillus rhamnosus]
DVAVVTTEFVPDGSVAVGRQSQTWVRLPVGWRGVGAHGSWMPSLNPPTHSRQVATTPRSSKRPGPATGSGSSPQARTSGPPTAVM